MIVRMRRSSNRLVGVPDEIEKSGTCGMQKDSKIVDSSMKMITLRIPEISAAWQRLSPRAG